MLPPTPRRRRALLSAAAVIAATASAAVFTPAAFAVPSHQPIGNLETLSISGQTLTAKGWAGDPDSASAVTIHVTVNGGVARTAVANQTRPDVALVHPGLGALRGFKTTLPLPGGDFTVCVSVVNLGAGTNTTLRCSPIAVGPITKAPTGNVEGLSLSAGAAHLHGWTFDADTPRAPVRIYVTANGAPVGTAVATAARPDVGVVYRAAGAAHGFPATVPLSIAPGNYNICVTARNTARGPSATLSCAFLTLRPTSPPAELNKWQAASAASALRAQVLASRAGTSADFVGMKSDAATIARATSLLLAQAAGRRAAPPALTGAPKFRVATPTAFPDEQVVMGRTPSLGSWKPAKSGGRTGAAHSLETFADDGLQVGGTGDGLIGAAPVLASDGVTVNPTMPALPAGYRPLRAEVAVRAALAKLGNPYVFAAAGPNTFDCSGLTKWAWGHAGVDLYHYTGTQAVQGVRVQPWQLLPGDLLLFGYDFHHVAIYLGAGYMIDAPYTGAYVAINRVADYGDFTLAVRP